jgi:two-component system, LytTR family, sensor kinase
MLTFKRINAKGFRIIQHILFWSLCFLAFLHLFKTGNRPEKIDYIYTGLFQLTVIPAVYINLEWLLPYFNRTKKLWLYVLGLAALLTIFPYINYKFFQDWSAWLLPDYFFISYFSLTEVILFFSVYIILTSLLKLSRAWFTVNELRQQLLQSEKEKVQIELKSLRSQINPHFLFNTLNSIYSLSLDKDSRLPGTVLQLSDIMRYYLYESREDFVSLEKELQILNDYIQLQRIRSGALLDLDMEVSGEVKDKKIAPLLLLTFAENAFKHGAKGETGKSFIHLRITITEEKFHFFLENNKGRIDTVEPDQFRGLGLENVRRRLALLYPSKHQLWVNEARDRFSITLQLDL